MKLKQLAIGVATAAILTACGGGGSSSSKDDSSELNLDNVRALLNTNADIALAAYNDSVATAEDLQDAIDALRADPSEANLEAAKKAWLVAREPYGQTEVYRFRLSPIDSTDYENEDGLEGDINAWPLGEALIDYVVLNDDDDEDSVPEGDFGTAEVGVTNNSIEVGTIDSETGAYEITSEDYSEDENIIARGDIAITKELLANTATADDEHDVIAGYHAIEFLLWGQDLNESGETTEGDDRGEAVKAYNFAHGGQRSAEAFTDDTIASGSSSNETLGERRLTYLEVAAEKLVEDLKSVRDGWKNGAIYRTAFTTVTNETEALQKLAEILTGMGTLSEGELAGERMQIAFSGNSQEDEHSCFSDNTHRDIWLNAEGVSNSYYGTYAGYDSTLDGTDNETASAVNGYGFDDLLADMGETTLKASVETALANTAIQYTAIDAAAREGRPFDVLIMAENRNLDSPVAQAIIALNNQAQMIAQVADALNISATVLDDDASACNTENPTATCD